MLKMSAKKKKPIRNLYTQSILEEALFAMKVLYGAAAIKGFPYYKSYMKTVRAESRYARGVVLAVGCGPLPLTAICLNKIKSKVLQIDMMDKSHESVVIAKALTEKMYTTRSKLGSIIERDAVNFSAYQRYNTIILALEAGSSIKEKQKLLRVIHTQMDNDSILILRSSNTSNYVDASVAITSDMFSVIDKVSVFDGLSTSYVLQKCKYENNI